MSDIQHIGGHVKVVADALSHSAINVVEETIDMQKMALAQANVMTVNTMKLENVHRPGSELTLFVKSPQGPFDCFVPP